MMTGADTGTERNYDLMGKYTGLLICSDFDGTLCKHQTISHENLEAIDYFQKNGGMFTLATGRYPTILRHDFAKGFTPNAPLISANGALIYDIPGKKILAEGLLPSDYIPHLQTICRTIDGIRSLSFFPREHWNAVELLPGQSDLFDSLIRNGVYKVVFHLESAENSDAVTAAITALSGKDFLVSRSWLTGIEVQGISYNKGTSARKLANLLSAEQLIAIGDYENDIPLLRAADVSYAVQNAIPALKEIADFVTTADVSSAVAEMIYSL